MTKNAVNKLFKQSGLSASDIQVVELHDCFSANELITYEALGLCDEGKAGEFIDAGDNTYGGKYVVNPSGGLIRKGENFNSKLNTRRNFNRVKLNENLSHEGIICFINLWP